MFEYKYASEDCKNKHEYSYYIRTATRSKRKQTKINKNVAVNTPLRINFSFEKHRLLELFPVEEHAVHDLPNPSFIKYKS